MVEMLKNEQVLELLFIIGLIGLFVALQADNLQTIAKYRGAINKRIAHGYNVAMKVMLINRLGIVVFFFLVAFNVDNALMPEKLVVGFGITILLLAFPSAVAIIWLHGAQKKSVHRIIFNNESNELVLFILTFTASIFNLIGLTIPWIAATMYPDLRLTLMNTSFIFNSVFSVINVFYIENRLASAIDTSETKLKGFVMTIMMARLIAFLLIGVIFLTV